MQFIKLASRNKLIFGGFAAIAMVVIVLVGLVYAALQTMERSTCMDLHSNEVLRVEERSWAPWSTSKPVSAAT